MLKREAKRLVATLGTRHRLGADDLGELQVDRRAARRLDRTKRWLRDERVELSGVEHFDHSCENSVLLMARRLCDLAV